MLAVPFWALKRVLDSNLGSPVAWVPLSAWNSSHTGAWSDPWNSVRMSQPVHRVSRLSWTHTSSLANLNFYIQGTSVTTGIFSLQRWTFLGWRLGKSKIFRDSQAIFRLRVIL